MKIDFANLNRAYALHKEEFDSAMSEVVRASNFIMGKAMYDLEETLSRYVGVKHCISCASGTDALLLALMALDIKQGDEVITTPFTFFATAEVIALCGATPVFVDIDLSDYNIDIQKIESAITPQTKAIMPVSLYGQMADMPALLALAKKHGLKVIEDAAQSFGATYSGQKSGSYRDVGCTSFFPAKPLGCFGDGGAVFTDDDLLAEKLRSLRVHGQTGRYIHKYVGIGGRLDTIQATVLNVKMKYYESDIKGRRRLADYYNRHIESSKVIKPFEKPSYTSVWAQYTLRIDPSQRDDFQAYLTSRGIPTAIHYPKPMHLQECFQGVLAYREGDFPIAERVAKEVISLPMNPYFTEEEKAYIVEAVNGF